MSRWCKLSTFDGDPCVEYLGMRFMYWEKFYPALKKLAELEDLEEQGRLIEQKYGRWYPMHFGGVWQCSECGYLTKDNRATPYCPNCGAKMEE